MVVAFLLLLPETVFASKENLSGSAINRTNRIIIKLKEEVDLKNAAKYHMASGAKVKKALNCRGKIQVVEIPKGSNIAKIIDRYKKSGLVEYAEPDYIMEALVVDPNDPKYANGSQWGLRNIGLSGYTAGDDIDARIGWDTIQQDLNSGTITSEARNVVVAVVDTGVHYEHEDLINSMWINSTEDINNNGKFDNWLSTETRDGVTGDLDGIDDDNDGYVDDVCGVNCIDNYINIKKLSQPVWDPEDDNYSCGHGTHVSGIISASGNNSLGVVGVAWQLPAKIMACKVLNYNGAGYSSDVAEGIEYALMKGAKVISLSLGGAYTQTIYDAIADARDHNVIVVAAAGNAFVDLEYSPTYPAAFDLDNIITVTGSDGNDQPVFNYGLQSADIAAPGWHIYSATYNMRYYPDDDARYMPLNGTSMATPFVTGVTALLFAEYPNERYDGIIARILDSAEQVSALEDRSASHGRLNLANALSYVPPELHVEKRSITEFGGSVGGPYSDSQTFRLYNFAITSIDWTATKSVDWLTVSPSSGTLEPNATATVTLSINSTASTLTSGKYTDTVAFTNADSGSGNTTRDVSLCVGTLYVDGTNGSDYNNGFAWGSAKQTVQAAIDTAGSGSEVWVKAGTYNECIALKRGVALYGGFAGSETARDSRDWQTNVTLLDGYISGLDSPVVKFQMDSGSSTRLDGFTIQHGNGMHSGAPPDDDWQAMHDGCGVYCAGASPIICNNVISDNQNAEGKVGHGGGIYLRDSQASVLGNTITGNTVRGDITASYPYYKNGEGGGIYCQYSTPTLSNNIISQNNAGVDNNYPGAGGGIMTYNSNPIITGNIISDNTGTALADGIYSFVSQPTIANNTIFNSLNAYGVAILCSDSSAIVSGNKITDASVNSVDYGNNDDVSNNIIVNNLVINGTLLFGRTGLFQNGATPSDCSYVTNNTFVGKGIRISEYSPELSPTISNNLIACSEFGVYEECSSGTQATLYNNCFYSNTTNYYNVSPGSGDITPDASSPMFVNITNNNYHLLAGSPCINSGLNTAPGIPSADIDGNTRQLTSQDPVDIGADEFYGLSVASVKEKTDGSAVYDQYAVVSAAWDSYFYIESPDRASGIRVDMPQHGHTVGDQVDVAGYISTNEDRERFIAADYTSSTGTGSVTPLTMNNRDLGGGDFEYSSSNGMGQKGIDGAFGWNNIGLLVRAYGVVSDIHSNETPAWFRINDGSDLSPLPKVILPDGADIPDAGDYIAATGISSCEAGLGDAIYRVLKAIEIDPQVASNTKVQYDVYDDWNLIGLPRVPMDSSPLSVFGGDPPIPAISIDGYLTRKDAPTQTDITYDSISPSSFGNMLMGDGYWLYCSNPGTIVYDALPDGVPDGNSTIYDVCISLPGNQLDNQNSGGWHFFAHPFAHETPVDNGDYSGDRILFTDGHTVKTWHDAAFAGWVSGAIYGFDGEYQCDFMVGCNQFRDLSILEPGHGYQLCVFKDNLAIIIPAN